MNILIHYIKSIIARLKDILRTENLCPHEEGDILELIAALESLLKVAAYQQEEIPHQLIEKIDFILECYEPSGASMGM